VGPPSEPVSFAAGRYEVERFLGEGARKRVFLARDSRLDRDVAVAIIKTEGLDEIGLARVRREAKAMARLGDHPNIVTVHDISEEEDRPLIVSQFMAGGSLADLLDRTEGRRVPIETAVRIATEVARALEHAHERGVVHRDLKPGNIWLTEAGAAMLGDFGLAIALDRSRLTSEGMMVGTVAYMPPEQATGREPDARADLYSLGCVLYEMLTGRPPFTGDDAVAMISQHINTPPVSPSWHNASVPPALEMLVLDLLAKAPEDRVATASDARARLEQIAAPSTPVAAAATSLPQTARVQLGGTPAWVRFIGRDAELGILRGAVDTVFSGRGAMLMVVGEPGIGKTRIAEEAGVYARLRGAQVLLGRCYESEASLPYIPFVQAIRQYVMEREPDALRSELADGASDVAKLVSEIRQRIPDLPEPPQVEPEQERYRLFESVASFLVNASNANPVVLVLDDLHWADKPSLLLLQHLARRVPASRLMIVGTYRDVELDRRHPLSETLASLRREHAFERVLLRGLNVEEVAKMLEAAAQHELGARGVPLAQAIHRESEGNPFFIEEIVRHLVETGGLYRRGDQWAIGAARIEDLGIPEGIKEVIGRRLSRLSEACNAALSHGAVVGREFEFSVVAAMSGLDDDAMLGAIEEALEHQLIVEAPGRSGPTYAFTHALVRQTLYDELSLPRKQRLHLKAGEAIESVHARNVEPYVSPVAVHYRLAGAAADPQKTIGYSLQAAQAAANVFGWEEAATHLQAALELMDEQGAPPEARAGLLERLGTLMYAVGLDLAAGVRHLEQALRLYESLGSVERAARVHTRLAFLRSTFPETMDIDAAHEHLDAARATMDESVPRPVLGYLYLGYASAALWSAHPDSGLEMARRARAVGEALGNDVLASMAQSLEGWFESVVGNITLGLEMLEEAWQKADALNHYFASFLSTWLLAGVHGMGRWDPVRFAWTCERELALPRVEQAPNLRRALEQMVAFSMCAQGRFDEARQLVGDVRLDWMYVEPYMAMYEGDWDAAERILNNTMEVSVPRGSWITISGSRIYLAWIARWRGEFDHARAFKAEDLQVDVERELVWPEATDRFTLAEIEADAGRLDVAEGHIARCRELFEQDDYGGRVAYVDRAEGRVAAARGQFAAAEAAFRRADEGFATFAQTWERAETYHVWGRALLASGDKKRAIEKLGEALDIYRTHGAGAAWIERVLVDRMAAQGIDPSAVQTSIDAVYSAAGGARSDLTGDASADGTVAILFCDIEGSTMMAERLGDERWLSVLRRHNEIVRENLVAHHGTEVKSLGDGFMLAFPSAADAVSFATAVQRSFSRHNDSHPDQAIRVRVGVHAGQAIREGEDFFGKTVILAARIAAEARGGEILVSDSVRSNVRDLRTDELRAAELKGLSGRHDLHRVAWSA